MRSRMRHEIPQAQLLRPMTPLFLPQRNLGDKKWESERERAAFMEEGGPQAKQV